MSLFSCLLELLFLLFSHPPTSRARILLEAFPGGYVPVALCFPHRGPGGSPMCVHRMGSCYDLAGLTQTQVNSSSVPLTRVHSSQSFPSPKAQPMEPAHSNISCRYVKLYCLLPTLSATPLHGCVHGLGNAGTPGPPITLPWPWVPGICLMQLKGKKHREDNWWASCGKQEGAAGEKAEGYLQISCLHPNPSSITSQSLSPGIICSL